MPAYRLYVDFEANNVDVALAVALEITNALQDAHESGELEGASQFAVDQPMVHCIPAPEGVAPFPASTVPKDSCGRDMVCSCCGTTENLHADLGSGGPYRCNSPDCMVF